MVLVGVRFPHRLSMSIKNIEELEKLTAEELREYVQENQSDTFAYGDLPIIEIDGDQYAIAFDDDEADKAVTEYIREHVWAFSPEFIAETTGLPEGIFDCLAKSNMCEAANEHVLECINQTCGLDSFVADAIKFDGRGHFLSLWDGEEIELTNSNAYAYQI